MGDVQVCRDGSDDERQEEETEDECHLSSSQEPCHGRDALRVRVDEVEFAAGQLRGAREVVHVEAVLLEALRAKGGACRGRVDVVPRAIDGDAL